jgi:hypothetical protein
VTRREALARLQGLARLTTGPPGAGDLPATKATLAAIRDAAPSDELTALTRSARHALAIWQSSRAWQRRGEAISRDRARRTLRRLRDPIEQEWPTDDAA